MRKLALLLLVVCGLLWPKATRANEAWRGWCEMGNQRVLTNGLNSTTKVQASYPQCTIQVNVHGGGLATIFADNNGTPLANPFTSQTSGLWIFYAANGRYDVTTTSAGFPQPVTYSDILLCDPAVVGAACGNIVNTAVNIFHNNVLVGAEPGIDFVDGVNVTLNPTTDDPTNKRVHLTFNSVVQVQRAGVAVGAEPIVNFIPGTNVAYLVADNPGSTRVDVTTSSVEQVLNGGAFVGAEPKINFKPGTNITYTMADNVGNQSVDVTINASGGGGGSGCILPGTNTGVLSEHPASTCYDSTNWTWDDGVNKQNMKIGGGANAVGTQQTYLIGPDNNLAGQSFSWAIGFDNDFSASGKDSYGFGENNIIGTSGGTNFTIGSINSIYDGNLNMILNYNNAIGQSGTTGIVARATIAGTNNSINCCLGTNSSTGDDGIFGNSNDIALHGTVNNPQFIYGYTNHCDGTDGAGGGCYIFGLDNFFYGGASADVAIAGSSNTVRSVLNTGTLGASDNFIGGFLNTAQSSGNFVALGGNHFLHCTVCEAIGFSAGLTANNTVSVGFSTVPELTITQANVRRTPGGITNGPVINAVRTSGGTVTGTIGQTCNVSFTGGTGSGGTAVMYLIAANSASGAILTINAGGSYTGAPTGGTLSNGTATCSSTITATTVLGLVPACAAGTEGSYAAVVDSTVNTWGTTIAGGGANHVLAYCDGTNWTVAGK